MKQQRRCAFAVAAAFDFTDKNHVVAFFVATSVEALKAGCRTGQQRRAAASISKQYVVPAIVAFAGKAFSQLLLVSRQDIDGVMRTLAQCSHGARSLRQAPKHQWRA